MELETAAVRFSAAKLEQVQICFEFYLSPGISDFPI